MTEKTSGPAVPRRGIIGWMFFDWAAQPFFTVITTFVFGPYIVSRMVDDPDQGQTMWSFGLAAAGLVIALLSPVLGSIADNTGPRKPWIGFFAVLKIAALCLMWFAAPGSDILWVLGLFIIATVAAEFSIVFNDSMMPSLISKEQVGRISNIAWGLGYLGGMLVLVIILGFFASNPDTGLTILGQKPALGLDPKLAEGDRASAPLSALWYLVFIIPMFLFTPDLKGRKPLGPAISQGLTALKSTFGEVRQRAGIFRFLIARMIYQDGVTALLALGGTFAAGMFGWITIELGIFGIILNVVAIFGCMVAAWMDARMGSKSVVLISILFLIAATVGIISTGPGYTLFGLLELPAKTLAPVWHPSRESIYCLWSVDRFGIRSGTSLLPLLPGAQRAG